MDDTDNPYLDKIEELVKLTLSQEDIIINNDELEQDEKEEILKEEEE